MLRLLALLVVIIVVGYASRPTEESLTPCVSSRIATNSDDPTYAALSEQHNRSIDVNSELQTLNDLQQYPNLVFLAQTRRAELDDAIVKVQNMPLVAQQRDRVLSAMREEQDQMLRVIVAASESR
jgi:hypothetical protein